MNSPALLIACLLLCVQLPVVPAGRVDVERYPNGRIASVRVYRDDRKAGTHTTWWANGSVRSVAQYADDAYDGGYWTWYETGRPYEMRQFVRGRESGRQQSWTRDGVMYLNYEVREGRRYGLVNARPCVPTGATE